MENPEERKDTMKVAIVGSREVDLSRLSWLEALVPKDCTAIVSGGARGVDQMAWEIAQRKGITCIELLPDYGRFGRGAPLVRDREIVKEADLVLAVWDGASRGTWYVMEQCRKTQTTLQVYHPDGSVYPKEEWVPPAKKGKPKKQ